MQQVGTLANTFAGQQLDVLFRIFLRRHGAFFIFDLRQEHPSA